jgi:hypothetical protein
VADTITNVVEAKYKACRNSPAVITIRNNNIVVIWVSSWLGLHAQLNWHHAGCDTALHVTFLKAAQCVTSNNRNKYVNS